MKVITRFAPSPTGYLHIGGARTALFNWLFARHHGGKFLLRIEDTDRERSTEPAIQAILSGMKWIGLEWDGEPVYQFARASRHAEVAKKMVEEGKAYYCYCTAEELQEMRAKAQAEGKGFKYDGRWRDRDPKDSPKDIKPSIRVKAPRDGETVIKDLVQGDVVIQNSELDDMVILRSDGTPTYMLAVVVDDHDMEVTHVIRGDDHLTNAARQMMIYNAMGWEVPIFAHVPMIHGPDGAKLSKRHGALGVEAYRDMGYLPEAMRNYLLRLGWSHGDDEIISTEKAIEWFNIESIGKSPARFDFDKLNNLNGHYIRQADKERLFELIKPILEKKFGSLGVAEERIKKAMNSLKERAKTIPELAESAGFYVKRVLVELKPEERQMLVTVSEAVLDVMSGGLGIDESMKKVAEEKSLKPGQVFPFVRIALTGSKASPGKISEIADALGKEETIARLKDIK